MADSSPQTFQFMEQRLKSVALRSHCQESMSGYQPWEVTCYWAELIMPWHFKSDCASSKDHHSQEGKSRRHALGWPPEKDNIYMGPSAPILVTLRKEERII